MKLDILALAAHPDDIELCCGGTLIKQGKLGYKVGVVDFTQGEMGTRGTPELRLLEAKAAGKIMGLSIRDNLAFKDVYFTNDEMHRLEVIKMIRRYRPEVVLINAPSDRHPDHGKASSLSAEAVFQSGLRKIETVDGDHAQEAWRPKVVYRYIQGRFIEPDFVVDVTEDWEAKMNAIKAYKSQFYDPASKEPSTWLSSPEFFSLIEGRGVEFGQAIGAKYGEGFLAERWIGVKDLMNLK